MNSTDILNENLIFLGIHAEDKNQAIAIMADLLEEQEILSNKKQFISDVQKREADGITGIGDGFAIPHGISQGVKKDTIAVGILNRAVTWESIDEEKIKVIVMFAVAADSKESSKRHLKMMAKVAAVLAHDEKKRQLKTVTTAKEAVAVFAKRKTNYIESSKN